MKQTAQFGLNQWERTDRVLMDDFNNDNKKIDAALAGLESRSGLRLIKSLEVQKSFRNAEIPVADIDWTKWKAIHMTVLPASGTSSNVNFCFNSHLDVVGRISTKWTHVIFYPLGRRETPIVGAFWGATSNLFLNTVWTFGALGFMQLFGDSTSDQIAAGTKIIVQGEPM